MATIMERLELAETTIKVQAGMILELAKVIAESAPLEFGVDRNGDEVPLVTVDAEKLDELEPRVRILEDLLGLFSAHVEESQGGKYLLEQTPVWKR